MQDIEIKLTNDELLALKRGQEIVWISYGNQIKVTISK